MKTILLIGAGNLGSRHLQSLASLGPDFRVAVADPSENSRKTAEERYNEVRTESSPELELFSSVELLENEPLLAIVATSSKERLACIRELYHRFSPEFLILEKFLFSRTEEYTEFAELAARKNIHCWVNTPRRTFNIYRQIHELLYTRFPVHMTVSGSQWGLGCNSIHFIDVFEFISGDIVERIDTSGLDKNYIESKRPGYIDFNGTVDVYGVNGSTLRLISYAGGNHPITVSIRTENHQFDIVESQQVLFHRSAENGWKTEEQHFTFPRQSETTAGAVMDILTTNTCMLTGYAGSAQQHMILLESLRHFIEKNDVLPVNQFYIT